MPACKMQSRTIRRGIQVSGIVQGVGFRPYVYRLASEGGLGGRSSNTAAGVVMEVQGSPEAVEDFLARLPREAPPLALITGIDVRELPCDHDRDFQIVTSHVGAERRVLISPDVATCADCVRELLHPPPRPH